MNKIEVMENIVNAILKYNRARISMRDKLNILLQKENEILKEKISLLNENLNDYEEIIEDEWLSDLVKSAKIQEISLVDMLEQLFTNKPKLKAPDNNTVLGNFENTFARDGVTVSRNEENKIDDFGKIKPMLEAELLERQAKMAKVISGEKEGSFRRAVPPKSYNTVRNFQVFSDDELKKQLSQPKVSDVYDNMSLKEKIESQLFPGFDFNLKNSCTKNNPIVFTKEEEEKIKEMTEKFGVDTTYSGACEKVVEASKEVINDFNENCGPMWRNCMMKLKVKRNNDISEAIEAYDSMGFSRPINEQDIFDRAKDLFDCSHKEICG